MASAVTSERFTARNCCHNYDHDPGATTAVLASPDGGTTPWSLDMALYGEFICGVRGTIIGGGGVTKVEIVAADDSTLATHLTVIKDSGTVAADSLNDNVWLSCLASEIEQLSQAAGYKLRYVGVRITMATNTDEANVTFIGASPRFAYPALTTTVIT
jgi:hypothetical protein